MITVQSIAYYLLTGDCPMAVIDNADQALTKKPRGTRRVVIGACLLALIITGAVWLFTPAAPPMLTTVNGSGVATQVVDTPENRRSISYQAGFGWMYASMKDAEANRPNDRTVGKQSYENSLTAYDPQAYRDGAQAAIMKHAREAMQSAFQNFQVPG